MKQPSGKERFEKQQSEADLFGGSWVAAKYWQALRERGFSESIGRMAETHHWETMLPAMDVPHAAAVQFLEVFDTRKRMIARHKAIGGLLAVRDWREKFVVRIAKELSAALVEPPHIVPDGLLNAGKGALTDYLCQCIADGDWKSLETMAKIIKRHDEPEDSRGGELSYEGQTWGAFCLLHFNRMTLPTKREIRDEMTLSESNRCDFSKWLANLGLGGLPNE